MKYGSMARVETLFKRYQDRGDAKALGKVFDRTADETLRIAMHFARHPAEAEEWLQQTYLIAIERAESWDPSRRFMPWLLGILRNVVRRSQAARPDLALGASPPSTRAAFDSLEGTEWTRAVSEAVERLDDPYRAVLILRLQHDLAPAAIAQLRRVPPATVRSQLHRGLALLRSKLAPKHQPRSLRALPLPVGISAIREHVLAQAVATSALTATAVSSTTWLIGGLAMNKLAAGLLGAALLAFALTDPLSLWHTRSTENDSTVSDVAATPTESDTEQAPTLSPIRTNDDSIGTHAGEKALHVGPDINLDTVDRDRDVHGIVVLKDGTPVPGADVVFEHQPGRSLMTRDAGLRTWRVLSETKSGPRGTFALRLRPGMLGRLRVTANHLDKSRIQSVVSGERVTVVIDESVTLRIVVKAPNGDPVNDVPVEWITADRLKGRTTTDENGVARVVGLPPASTVTYLRANPHRKGLGAVSLWEHVTLPAQGVSTQVIQLEAGHTLTGVIRDQSTSDPVPGAHVGLGWPRHAGVRTDDAGRYTLHSFNGFVENRPAYRSIGVAADGYATRVVQVTEKRHVLDISLTRGATLKGRVVDHQEQPVVGAHIAVIGSVREKGTDGISAQRMSLDDGTTDESGQFVVNGLAPDLPHSINVRATGHARRMVDVDAIEDGTFDVGTIKLERPKIIRGVVVDEDEKPISHMRVTITGVNPDRAELRASKKPAHDSFYGTYEEVYTNDLGRFTFSDLCAAEYVLKCELGDGLRHEQLVSVSVELPHATVTIKLHPLRVFEIQVLTPDGHPPRVAGSIVAIRSRRGKTPEWIRAKWDSSGRATLRVPIECTTAKTQLLKKTAYINHEFKLPTKAGALTVHLRSAASIQGVLLAPNGTPIPRAAIQGRSKGVSRAAVTDAKGRFTMKCLANETMELSFRGQVFENGPLPYTARLRGIKAGATNVEMKSVNMAGSLDLRLRFMGPGGPLEKVNVFMEPGVPGKAHKISDSDGRVRFEKLSDVPRVLKMFTNAKDGSQRVALPMVATPGAAELVVRMSQPILVMGTLRDERGLGLPKIVIDARTVLSNGTEHRVGGGYTNDNGTFGLRIPRETNNLRMRAETTINGRDYVLDHVYETMPTGAIELVMKPK